MDRYDVSTRTAAYRNEKAVMNSMCRTNAVDLEFSANAEHVTIIRVASACGSVCYPLPYFQEHSEVTYNGWRQDRIPTYFLVRIKYGII